MSDTRNEFSFNAELLDAYPDFGNAFFSYLSVKDITNLSLVNKHWKEKTKKYWQIRMMHSLLSAILSGDQRTITRILKINPSLIFQNPKELGFTKIICPHTKREYEPTLSPLKLGFLLGQYNTINLLTYFIDTCSNRKEANVKANEIWEEIKTPTCPASADDFKQLINLIHTKSIDPLDDEIQSSLNKLQEKLTVKKPLNFDNYFNIAEIIILAHKTYEAEIKTLSVEEANYYYLNVIRFIQKLMPPELANIYLNGAKESINNYSPQTVFQFYIEPNIIPQFYEDDKTQIVFLPTQSSPIEFKSTEKIGVQQNELITIASFEKFERIRQEGLNKIKSNIPISSEGTTEAKTIQAEKLIAEAERLWPTDVSAQFPDKTLSKLYLDALALNPINHFAVYKLGLIEHYLQNSSSDLRYMQVSAEIEPEFQQALLHLKCEYIIRNNTDDAESALLDLLKSLKKEAELSDQSLAVLLVSLGRVSTKLSQKLKYYSQAIAHDPNNRYAQTEFNKILSRSDSFIYHIISDIDSPLVKRKLLLDCLDPTTPIGKRFANDYGKFINLKSNHLRAIYHNLLTMSDDIQFTSYFDRSDINLPPHSHNMIKANIKKEPQSTEEYFGLANDYLHAKIHVLLWRTKKPEHIKIAQFYLNQIIKREPNNDLAYFKRGEVHFLNDDYVDAVDDFTHAIIFNPKNIEYYKFRARAYIQTQNIGGAIGDYHTILRLDPTAKWYKTCLSLLFKAHDKNTIFNHIKNLPRSQQILILNDCLNQDTLLGKLFFSSAGLKNSILQSKMKNYLQKLTTTPQTLLHNKFPRYSFDYYLDQANKFFALKRYDEALNLYDYCIKLDNSKLDTYLLRANTYISKRNFKAAMDDLNHLINLGTENYDVYYTRASLYVKNGQHKKAISDLTKALTLNPKKSADIYLVRAEFYLNQYVIKGNEGLNEAIIDFNDAFKLNPKIDRKNTALYHFFNGRFAFQLEESMLALKKDNTLNELVLSICINSDTLVGKLFYDTREPLHYDKTDGLKKIITSVQTNALPFKGNISESAEKSYVSGHEEYQNKNFVSAIEKFRDVIEKEPNYAPAYQCRGAIYFERDKIGLSLYDFHQVQQILKNDNLKLDALLEYLGKENTFIKIKELPLDKQCKLLRACLDKTTQIGQFFWKKRGNTECSLNKGMLKKICLYLADIDNTFPLPFTLSAFSIFKGSKLYGEVALNDLEVDNEVETNTVPRISNP